jgi:uroporphyrinogen-III decarboxylase
MTFQQALQNYILSMDQFMLALYDYPTEIRRFLDRPSNWVVEIIRQAAAAGVAVVFLQDDYGANRRALISPKMWREITFPHLKRFAAVAHEVGVPLMLHSCGYQMPFLQRYVDAEVDGLQSFQPKAGNDFSLAVQQYGNQLAFATGIDVQQGEWLSTEEVRQSIIDSCEIEKQTGRHILAMTHMMQYTMPFENIQTIFRTVQALQE